ncbi:tetratricopeptide repeat protein [Pseudoteredinibacter isoporae]|uniref:tetratricopeptide repeat protein n=1 Tax=Pseudoteredinibacter isoporae TaxID=570281 RepID=UPI00334247D5
MQAQWLGSEQCKTCHEVEYQQWQGSHHDWAMRPARAPFVLGDFSDITFEHFGDKSRFYRKGEDYFVDTQNAQGKLQSFNVAYTFGFYPLQQYLLQMPKGHLQALTIAWDSRPATEGGQRWFHLYPNEKIGADDPLHWTGAYFNWNSRCAECHSTNLQRNYQPETHSYQTQWSEVNVACEACHGPGGAHLKWAKAGANGADKKISRLHANGRWVLKAGEFIAKREQGPRVQGEQSNQISVCGSCHSRRRLLGEKRPHDAGETFQAQHALQSLMEPLYHRDGQIQDEVFVLGSFMQSKMYQHGVECSNCHEPHSLALKAPGNAVCSQCHVPAVYDQPKHHHHPVDSRGAQCVNCHMPETNYMVVDPRRDHSLRIPRPDLSDESGSPNACVQCHQDRSNEWASKHFKNWLRDAGKPLPKKTALAETEPGKLLSRVSQEPPVVAATILERLAQAPSHQSLLVAQSRLHHAEPMLREAAVNFLAVLPLPQRVQELLASLDEPVMAVRLAIARQTLGADLSTLDSEQSRALKGLWQDYWQSLLFHQDTAAGQLNLGLYHLAFAQLDLAEARYRKAITMEPMHLGAHLNLADVLRQRGKTQESLRLLRKISRALPQSAAAQHALGLALVRHKDYESALQALKEAAKLEPSNRRYGYVYAVALHSSNRSREALLQMRSMAKQFLLDAQGQQFLRQLEQLNR